MNLRKRNAEYAPFESMPGFEDYPEYNANLNMPTDPDELEAMGIEGNKEPVKLFEGFQHFPEYNANLELPKKPVDVDGRFDSSTFDADIVRARKDAERQRKISYIAEGLSNIFSAHGVSRGLKPDDGSFYTKMRDDGYKLLSNAQQNKKQALANWYRDRSYKQNEEMNRNNINLKNLDMLFKKTKLNEDDSYRRDKLAAEKRFKENEKRIQENKHNADNEFRTSKLAVDFLNSTRASEDRNKLRTTNDKFKRDKLAAEKLAAEKKAAIQKTKKAKLNSVQLRKAALADIGELAEKQFQVALEKGRKTGEYDPSSYGDYVDSHKWTPNFLKSDSAIEAKANAMSWLDSYLRDESGASIQPDELAKYYDTYFPVPGDTLMTVSNKKRLRHQKMKNARMQSTTESSINPFPVTVYKDGKKVVLNNEDELKDALSKGWTK